MFGFEGFTGMLIMAGVILAFLVVIGLVLQRLYVRASKETTFVRTGFGGQKVIMDGGSLVIPVLHEIIAVNMNTLRLVVERSRERSLITKDRMRVDVIGEFYVRVGKSADAIASAAQTLGKKTTAPEELRDLIEGKFVDALRSVAAGMSMTDLHEKRKDFVQMVQEAVQVDLSQNGLELESVSLTHLDQTARNFFSEDNFFDAEGLTLLTQEIEMRRKRRNEIEQDAAVQIQEKTTEAEKRKLTILQEEELARIEQKRSVDQAKAQADAETKTFQEEQSRAADEAEIARKRAVDQAQVEADQQVDIARQQKAIAISEKSKEEARAKADAEKARGEAVKATEEVETLREVEKANRAKAIALTKAAEEAETAAVEIRVTAEAEKAAAADRADAIQTEAAAEAEKIKVLAAANKERLLAEAEGLLKHHEAENSLNEEARQIKIRLAAIERLPEMIAASVKPMENIDSIRILDMGGAGLGQSGGAGSGQGGSGADGVVDAALRYRMQAPLVDGLLREIGFTDGLAGLAKAGVGSIAGISSEPATPAATIAQPAAGAAPAERAE